MKKVLFTSLLCGLCTLATMAVPAYPYPVPYTLEDGSVIMAQIHGDEYFSYVTDMQGNVIRGHKPSAVDSVVINAARRARQQGQIGGHFPLTGSPKSVAILLEFQDVPFTKTLQDFKDLLMKSGYSENGATGSCRDFFIACSDSIFQPQFDVYGPYKVSKNVAEYGGPGKDSKQAFKEALQLAVEDGVDFSQYDTDKDGRVDNVFFYYAGHNEAENGGEETIWPHASEFQNFSIGGLQFLSYACTSELKGDKTNHTQCAIGTFCHEFGHVLGLPDWYDTSGGDTDGKKDTYTIGTWSIMSAGNYNNDSRTPPSYSCYERWYLGWLKPVQLTEPNLYVLHPLTESREAYLITADNTPHNLLERSPSPTEFFMLEYRAATGWDAPAGALPGTGMLVWHIDYKSSNWAGNTPNNKEPMGYHLEEAGGRKGTSTPSDPYPGTAKKTTFIPTLHNGTLLNKQPIYKIEEKGGLLSFVYVNQGKERVVATPKSLDFFVAVNDKKKPVDWHADSIVIDGIELDSNEVFTLTTATKSRFFISANPRALSSRTSSFWSHKVVFDSCVMADSTFHQVVYVSYNPKEQSCETENASVEIQSQTSMLTVALTGQSPRPTLITTPKIKKVENITPYAFDVRWGAVSDAEKYYLTLYRVEKGTSEIMQGFENFDDRAKITAEGWQISESVSTTTSAMKEGKRSLLLRNSGEVVVSEMYPAAVSKVSFWVNAVTTSVDTVGSIQLEASRDGINWDKIKSFVYRKNTKSQTSSAEVLASKQYRQFRLTYTNLGGNGIAVDAFTTVATEKVTYLFKGKQKSITAEEGVKEQTYTFAGLTPASTYYVQIQCGENKGCEEHLTDISPARMVKTLKGEDVDSKYLTDVLVLDKTIDDPVEYNCYTHVIYYPEVYEDYTLYVYDLQGHLVWSTSIAAGQSSVTLPSGYFVKGKMYAAKYMPTNKMSRKDKWVKFMY